MALHLLCQECPFMHPAGEDCPPGWHDVRAEGGGDGGGGSAFKGFAVALLLMVPFYLLVLYAVLAVRS